MDLHRLARRIFPRFVTFLLRTFLLRKAAWMPCVLIALSVTWGAEGDGTAAGNTPPAEEETEANAVGEGEPPKQKQGAQEAEQASPPPRQSPIVAAPAKQPAPERQSQGPSVAKEQPKTLRNPIDLEPVTNETSSPRPQTQAPHSTPPIRLAPEPSRAPAASTEGEANTSGVAEIRPASFKGISPGRSTRDDLGKQLGEPREITASEGKQELVFKVEPFPSVRITLSDNMVSSIVINLSSPQPREAVVKDLQLGEFEPAIIRDDTNHALGEVYPERGLMFAYQTREEADESEKVSHVVLERISSEPFLLRVDQTPVDEIAKRRQDLRIVQQLSPDNAEAQALAARLDRRCGRLAAARKSAKKATEIDSDNNGYRVLLADIDRRLGHAKTALQAIQAVLADESISSLEESEAQLVLGRLLATTPTHDYKQAMKETVTAIKLAAAETDASDQNRQRKARQLLIRAELSLAEILAYGPWKQRHSVVPKWLASAEEIANEHIKKDDAPRDILLDLYHTSLHCLLALDGQGTPAQITDAAIRLGRELIANSEDLDYQSVVEWKLGTTLWRAAQVTQQQANTDEALRLADNAEALMSAASDQSFDSPNAAHALAQLHFLLGSIHAIHKHDHDRAMKWYDTARPHLGSSPYPDSLLDNRGPVGDQLVSIGISLWETDRRHQAVSVTKDGLEMIRGAVEAGTFNREALAVPYQNLATMYRNMGNEPEADKMARKAAEYASEPSSSNARR